MSDQTVAQTIDSCREHLLGAGRSEMNVLSTAITTTTSTTVVTTYPLNGITPGTIIAIDEEEMYVFQSNPGASTATVSSG